MPSAQARCDNLYLSTADGIISQLVVVTARGPALLKSLLPAWAESALGREVLIVVSLFTE